MSGSSEFGMKSDLPGYPFGSSPRALIAGKEPFHPPFKGCRKHGKSMHAVNAGYYLGVWPAQDCRLYGFRDFIIERFSLGKVPPDGPTEIVDALELQVRLGGVVVDLRFYMGFSENPA
jgi:hypothetical protein